MELALTKRLNFSCLAALVTGGASFYNPSNTAMETVVWFSRHHGTQPRNITVVFSVSE